MSLKKLLLISSRPGAGRTTLAANLALLLAQNEAVTLLESESPSRSELALHLGQSPKDRGTPIPSKGYLHWALSAESFEPALASLEAMQGWALGDGASLDQTTWSQAVAAFGAVLLVEKGDLQGFRRMQGLIKELESMGLPRSAMACVWMGVQASQPLPTLPGLKTLELPWDTRACERLGQARVWVQDEPQGLFAKRCRELLAIMQGLQPALIKAIASPIPQSQSPVIPGLSQEGDELLKTLSEKLRRSLEGKKSPSSSEATSEAQSLLAAEDRPWLSPSLRLELARRLVQDLLGLGPLEDLLKDPNISEVMVNHPSQVYIEKAGKLSLSDCRFRDEAQLRTIIERIVWPLGRRIDESSPKVDARLPDGSRVNAIIPPLAIKGPCLTIRKFPERRMNMDELVERGALSARAAGFLRLAVEHKRNILVSGGTGSGKTTLLNALSSYIPSDERIITIEDAAELRLQQPHVVTLEARPANLEGQGAVSIRDLVVNALRMRPDRIVIGECRGGEALDMLQAMNTGHEGSLTTLHANSPRDALQRLETLCLLSGVELPLKVVRQQVASAIDLVVQIGRLRDGSRRVLAIAELTGMEGEILSTQDLFVWRPQSSSLEPTGVPAKFFRQLQEDGEKVDFGVFQSPPRDA